MIRALALRTSLAARRPALRAVGNLPPSALKRTLYTSAQRWDDAKTPVGEIQPRLQLSFTCTVPDCGTRSTHEFSKHSYTKGVVLVECPGCKNRHLIADNLGWFTETSDEPRTIEEIVRAKNGKVRIGSVYSDGKGGETIEIEQGDDKNS